MKTPRVVDAILCENSRQELNGRFTLLGAFGGDLRIKSLPGAIPICVFAEVEVEEMGRHTAEFRVRLERGKTVLSAKMNATFDALGNSSIVIGAFPLRVEKEGTYRFQWKFEGGKWETLKALRISLDPELSEPQHGTLVPDAPL